MNILIADKFEDSGIAALKKKAYQLMYSPDLSGSALRDAVAATQCEVLVVRSTEVLRDILEASPSLALVVRAGAGFNTIDMETASRKSIFVANCPGKNAVAVAELTFALMLGLDRRLVENVSDLRQGVWNKRDYSEARGLKGRMLGIVGLGGIGQAVAQRGRAFGLRVMAWSRSLTDELAEELGVKRCQSIEDVARSCDILSIHLAAAPETKGIVNEAILKCLKPGSYVINTSRADVLDYQALMRVMKERELRVGLDVYPDEPSSGQAAFQAEVVNAGGLVYGTHHIGASTQQAQEAIAAEMVRVVTTFFERGEVLNCVNVRSHAAAACVLRVRHLNQPGVLAFVLNQLSRVGINVEEMENIICHGGTSACAQILLEKPVPDNVLERIRNGHEHILGVNLAMRSAKQT